MDTHRLYEEMRKAFEKSALAMAAAVTLNRESRERKRTAAGKKK